MGIINQQTSLGGHHQPYTKGPSSAQVAGRTAKGIAGEESSGPDSLSQFGPVRFQEEVSRKNEKPLGANGSSRWRKINENG